MKLNDYTINKIKLYLQVIKYLYNSNLLVSISSSELTVDGYEWLYLPVQNLVDIYDEAMMSTDIDMFFNNEKLLYKISRLSNKVWKAVYDKRYIRSIVDCDRKIKIDEQLRQDFLRAFSREVDTPIDLCNIADISADIEEDLEKCGIIL